MKKSEAKAKLEKRLQQVRIQSNRQTPFQQTRAGAALAMVTVPTVEPFDATNLGHWFLAHDTTLHKLDLLGLQNRALGVGKKKAKAKSTKDLRGYIAVTYFVTIVTITPEKDAKQPSFWQPPKDEQSIQRVQTQWKWLDPTELKKLRLPDSQLAQLETCDLTKVGVEVCVKANPFLGSAFQWCLWPWLPLERRRFTRTWCLCIGCRRTSSFSLLHCAFDANG